MSEAFTPRERKSVVGGDPDVEHRRLGASGLKVSQLGLGGNTFGRAVDAAETAGIVAAALDLGVNFYDTADVYSQGVSETYLGAALAGKRDQAVIATKVHGPMGSGPNERGSSRAHIIAGVDASLDRLHTDYIDLLQLHAWDAETPLEETLRALDDLVRAGKIRYVGCSNFSAWQMVWGLWLADRRGWAPFVTNQSRYSLLSREVERELLPACRAFGVSLIGGHTEVTHGLDRPIIVGTMLGEVAPDKLVTTGGAQVGDVVLLTKGVPVEGVSIIARAKADELRARGFSEKFLERAHDFLHRPGLSVLPEALLATELVRVHAMHDPTEGGLATGLRELAQASGTGLRIEAERIPVLPEGERLCREFDLDPLGTAASGALILSLAPTDAAVVLHACAREGIDCVFIGHVVPAAEGITLTRNGKAAPLPVFHRDEIAKLFE